MDICVLNDARVNLAERMALLDIAELNYAGDSKAQGWITELAEMEKQHGYTSVEATLEYYIEQASQPQSVDELGIAIDFYLDSLFEWMEFTRVKA
jgi:hypothetical protein